MIYGTWHKRFSSVALPHHYYFTTGSDQPTDSEGLPIVNNFKARRAPFYWRELTPADTAVLINPLKYVVLSKKTLERVEAYCGSEEIAKKICDAWNARGALLAMTDGTAAADLI